MLKFWKNRMNGQRNQRQEQESAYILKLCAKQVFGELRLGIVTVDFELK